MSRPKDKPYTKTAPMGRAHPRRLSAVHSWVTPGVEHADVDSEDRGDVVRQPKKRRR